MEVENEEKDELCRQSEEADPSSRNSLKVPHYGTTQTVQGHTDHHAGQGHPYLH